MVPMKIIVRNETKKSISFPELGGFKLKPGEEMDLRKRYANPDAPMRALYVLETTELFKRLKTGAISVQILWS